VKFFTANPGARLCAKHQSQRVNYGCGLENFKRLVFAEVLRLGLRPQPRSETAEHSLDNPKLP
jgi:hypothetical protein